MARRFPDDRPRLAPPNHLHSARHNQARWGTDDDGSHDRGRSSLAYRSTCHARVVRRPARRKPRFRNNAAMPAGEWTNVRKARRLNRRDPFSEAIAARTYQRSRGYEKPHRMPGKADCGLDQLTSHSTYVMTDTVSQIQFPRLRRACRPTRRNKPWPSGYLHSVGLTSRPLILKEQT
jgi:hypothetical protein